MRPPRTQGKQNLGLLASPSDHKPAELAELEDEKLVGGVRSDQISEGTLAKANDPLADLSSSSSVGGTRGAATRARLQLELAQDKGLFFQSMSRRMAPTSSPHATAEELLNRGIPGVRYLERFGGYGRTKDLGQLQYQVMMIFDFLMAGNYLAAMDGVALLAVTLEQASLDGGRMELATLLCLQEDPPASIFVNRQLSSTSRARSFAPLADQKWVTCALPYLKEMEIIATKRSEMNAGGRAPFDSTSENALSKAAAKAKPKRQPKRKGRGKGQQESQEDAEADDITLEHEELVGQESNPLRSSISFCFWAFCLPRWILRCRTKFSWHLMRSFTAFWRSSPASPSTAFPLPVPFPGCFARKGLKFKPGQ